MGNRLGQLAGIFAFILVLARLGRLVQTGPDVAQWRLILVAAAFLGGVVWWLLRQLLTSRGIALAIYVTGGVFLFLRIAVPGSLFAGIIPSADTPTALVDEMDTAIRLIRSGIPPVLPTEGLIAVLAVLMWAVGALYVWGMTDGPVSAMVVPGAVLYLQFAIFDREPAGLGWMAASAAMLILAVSALALERRRDVGRARDSEGRAVPRRSAATALVMAGLAAVVAVTTANSASGVISEYGNIPWQGEGGGYGFGGGRVAFDRFIDLRQRLISRTNALLFRATLGEGAPPASQIYWRMETLDEFEGSGWKRSTSVVRNYEPGRQIGEASNEYQGTSVDLLHKVTIDRLAGPLVPTAGVATDIQAIDDDRALAPQSLRWTEDSAIIYPPELRDGDTYQISAVYPLQSQDLGGLATGADGQLSPMFAGASEAGLFTHSATVVSREVTEPNNLAFYTELPDNVPAAIHGIAALQTQGATTDFEKAWMLQHWFRDSGEFTYSTEVTTGHDSLVLENWLTDTTSPNFKTGYCEQFAASMAVLGRSLDIPSRVVWGFTPGRVTAQPNGVDVIEVRDTNAHAWAEMWMDGFGWVRFDPTPRGEFQPESITAGFNPTAFVEDIAARDSLSAPDEQFGEAGGLGGIVDDPPIEITPPGPRWWLIGVVLGALLIPLIPLVKAVRRRKRLKLIREGDITAAWDEIVDRLTDLGESVPPWKTPLEFANDTDSALLPLAVSYSAAIYGGRSGQARETDLLQAEGWMSTRFDAPHRARASLNLRSFMRRD